jgi:valyl-tRNA synthetase
VASGEIKFVPENWVNTYNQWLNNIQDWCISRQLWWGHQIPGLVRRRGGNIFVAHSEAEASAQAAKRLHGGADARPGRARHLVLLGPVALLDAGLDAGDGRRANPRSTSTCRRRCWSPASTSSSSGWRAWS